MAIAKKIEGFIERSSWIRKMFEEGAALKASIGEENVFDFTLGNPVVEPPDRFKQELYKAVSNTSKGMHRYMPNAGFYESREVVAKTISDESGLDIPVDNIIMTCGAAGGLNVVLKSILNPGDEVIIFSPYFVEYIFYIDNHAGGCRIVETGSDFNIDLGKLEESINGKTKSVIINSPNNPTGKVYDKDTLQALGRFLEKKERELNIDIYLISDDTYKKIIYDDVKFPDIFEIYKNSIIVYSHSKDLAIPGERIGYIAINPECSDAKRLVEGMIFCNRTLGFVNAPALMQRVVKELQQDSVDIASYQRKRDMLYNNLTNMGYDVTKPEGAFYIFPRSPIEDDIRFVRRLKEENILTVPGSGFGKPGYFRISYCVSDETIENSLNGFRRARKI